MGTFIDGPTHDGPTHDGPTHDGPTGAPPPWRVTDDGEIVDAAGRPIAYLASRLHDIEGRWRGIANEMAAAREMAAALADLLEDHEQALKCLGASDAMLQSPALRATRSALAKARQR